MFCAYVGFAGWLLLAVMMIIRPPTYSSDDPLPDDPPELPPFTMYIGFSCSAEFQERWQRSYRMMAFALAEAINRTKPIAVMRVEEESSRPCNPGQDTWHSDTLVYHTSCMFSGESDQGMPEQQIHNFEPMVRSVLYPLQVRPVVLVYISDRPGTVDHALLAHTETSCRHCSAVLLLYGKWVDFDMEGLRTTFAISSLVELEEEEVTAKLTRQMARFLEKLVAESVLRIDSELNARFDGS